MQTTKDLTLTATFTALLIGAQLALSAISGIEVVSVLFISYCYYFGVRRGIMVATVFSFFRCFLFGFFPQVIILYFTYYNLLAVVVGVLGHNLKRAMPTAQLIAVTATAIVMTVLFTLLDDVITPIFFRFSIEVANAYFYTSLATLIPHVFCVAVTVAILFLPLCKIYKMAKL